MSSLTPAHQRAFFETYGFLKMPGLVKNEIAQITTDFEAVFAQAGLRHDGTKHTNFIPFVDSRPGLCALLDHPGILAAVSNLLGPDFNYVSSDGNYYTGETGWHRDSLYQTSSYLKVAFYLDSVRRDTGCLRVIPGSHTDAGMKQWDDDEVRASEGRLGVHSRDLPAYPLENDPGDVLIFNHRTLHASFGGGKARRMFTMNLGRRAKTSIEIDDLISYGDWHMLNHGSRTPYGKTMLETASPERLTHLTQVQQFWPAMVEHFKLRTGKPVVAAA
ncbi:MAG: phytanoyl-CoA dioxygenase family protein [Opitutaceae bacterium]